MASPEVSPVSPPLPSDAGPARVPGRRAPAVPPAPPPLPSDAAPRRPQSSARGVQALAGLGVQGFRGHVRAVFLHRVPALPAQPRLLDEPFDGFDRHQVAVLPSCEGVSARLHARPDDVFAGQGKGGVPDRRSVAVRLRKTLFLEPPHAFPGRSRLPLRLAQLPVARERPAHPHHPFGDVDAAGAAGDPPSILSAVLAGSLAIPRSGIAGRPRRRSPLAYEVLSGHHVPQRQHGKLPARGPLRRRPALGVRRAGARSRRAAVPDRPALRRGSSHRPPAPRLPRSSRRPPRRPPRSRTPRPAPPLLPIPSPDPPVTDRGSSSHAV